MPRDYCDPKLMRLRLEMALAEQNCFGQQSMNRLPNPRSAAALLWRRSGDLNPTSPLKDLSWLDRRLKTGVVRSGLQAENPLAPLAYRQAAGVSNLRSTLQHRR